MTKRRRDRFRAFKNCHSDSSRRMDPVNSDADRFLHHPATHWNREFCGTDKRWYNYWPCGLEPISAGAVPSSTTTRPFRGRPNS